MNKEMAKKNSKRSRTAAPRPRRLVLALAALAALVVPSLYASTAMASCSISGSENINTGGALEDCTVSQSGTYTITEYGGPGGGVAYGSTFYNGSSGAEVTAQFSLTAGQVFEVVTGATGAAASSNSYTYGASGGGGTFLVLDNSGALTPYLVAGGGGGDSLYLNSSLSSTGTGFYGYGQGGSIAPSPPSSLSGDGGTADTSQNSKGGGEGDAGGGGGYLTGGTAGSSGTPGNAFISGSGYGNGAQGTEYIYNLQSGWGGGGGGYNGGEGGTYDGSSVVPGGFGGVSYYDSSLATNVTQVGGSGNVASPTAGQVDFALVSTTSQTTSPQTTPSGNSVPEPPSLLLFLLSLVSLFLVSRLRATTSRPAIES